MASGEDQALKILERQVEALTAQLQTLTSERDEYRDALTEVSDERDKLKTSPEAATQIADLQAKIRDRNHFDKFSELAKGEKAREGAVKHLWKLAEYKAEADEPDEVALKGVLKKLKTEAHYAFEDAEPPNMAAARKAAQTSYGLTMRGEEGRGARNDGGDGTVLTPELMANPRFMLDPRNRNFISEAVKARQEQRAREQAVSGPIIR